MKTLIHKLLLLTGICFSAAALNSCSKEDTNTNGQSSAQQNFESNVTNRNLQVSQSGDDGVNNTANFNGLVFRFSGTGSLSGTATASNSLLAVTGSWTVNASFDKLTISFPTSTLSQLAFMNKEWLINSSTSSSIVVLTAANGEMDVLQFTSAP